MRCRDCRGGWGTFWAWVIAWIAAAGPDGWDTVALRRVRRARHGGFAASLVLDRCVLCPPFVAPDFRNWRYLNLQVVDLEWADRQTSPLHGEYAAGVCRLERASGADWRGVGA
jgi:hypothetical protein